MSCHWSHLHGLYLHIRLLEIATFGDVDPWPLKQLNQMSLYAKKAV